MSKTWLFAILVIVVVVGTWFGFTYARKNSKTETFLESASKPKLALFHANWCKYCVEFLANTSHNGKNAFDAAADKLQGKVEFEKLDVDENKDLATKYGVSGFPTIVGITSSGSSKQFQGDREDVNAIVAFANSLS